MELQSVRNDKILKIDSREPDHWKSMVSRIASSFGIPFAIEPLRCGDYETASAIVERKSVSDLIASTYDKRLEKQFETIAYYADVTGKIPILLITGSVRSLIELKEQLGLRIDPHIVYGLISSIMTRIGAYILWIEDEADAAITMVKVLQKIDEGKWLKPRRRNVKVLLARALGIQSWQLDELLERFGSIHGIAEASVDELQVVPGIGKKRAETIKRILTGVIE